jgi:flavin-dependent dehydrogenase
VIDRGIRRAGAGETLPPAARNSLEDLGLWKEFEAGGHLAFFGNCSRWGSDEVHNHDFLYDPNGVGWRLDRHAFDSMLEHAARDAGAAWLSPASVASFTRLDSRRWELTAHTAGGEFEIDAALVIDASGRASSFARALGVARQNHDRLIAITAALKAAVAIEDTRTLVEATAHGWWYSGVAPDGSLAIMFFTDADLAAARTAATSGGWRKLLEQAPHTSDRVRASGYTGEPIARAMPANSSMLAPCTGDGWLAIGDAAAAYDPLSSQGILTALSGAELAFHAATHYLRGDHGALEKYQDAVERAFAIYLHNRSAFYRAERRWNEHEFWQRRAISSNGAATYITNRKQAEQAWTSHL